jgi:predicted branched-subunit amino acid permease
MIEKEFFFKGFKSILKSDSPAIALACCFVAIGALFKNLGFNIQESVFSTMLTYALPGSLVMAESLLVGSSLLSIFIAVWFVNARLYPMAVSLFPIMMHEDQPKWKYYLSCHFIAISAWLIMRSNYQEIEKKYRVDFWIGIGTATWTVSIIGYNSWLLSFRVSQQRYVNGFSNFKSNLFYLYDGWSNENNTNYIISFIRCFTWTNFLFFFT